jgi:hypothetical protein
MLKKTNNIPISAYIAGLASIFFVTPIDKMKIFMQSRKSIKSINLKNIFNGFIATSFREPPGYAIYFSTYYTLKPLLEHKLH